MQPNKKIDSLANPRAPTPTSGVPLLLGYDVGRKVYMCPEKNHRNVADDPSMACRHCKSRMTNGVPVVGPSIRKGEPSGEGGFLKGEVTYCNG